MNEKFKNGVTRAFNTIKAAGGILAALGAIMLWFATRIADVRELKTVPAQISTIKTEIQKLHDSDTEADKRLSLLEQNISFIREGVQELRADARERRRR